MAPNRKFFRAKPQVPQYPFLPGVSEPAEPPEIPEHLQPNMLLLPVHLNTRETLHKVVLTELQLTGIRDN